MKKNIFVYMSLIGTLLSMSGCKVEEGTEPNTDKAPSVIVYSYPDETAPNDLRLRLATNNAAESVYFLSEEVTDKTTEIEKSGETAYFEKVVKQGTKVESLGANAVLDYQLKNLKGDLAITFVAVSNHDKKGFEVLFKAPDWKVFGKGTYSFTLFKEAQQLPVVCEYDRVFNVYRINPWPEQSNYLMFTIEDNRVSTFGSNYFYTGVEYSGSPIRYVIDPNYESTYDPAAKSFSMVIRYVVGSKSYRKQETLILE